MNLGTKSLLFGVHQFLWHPIMVWRAWRALYGRPTWRECVCIVIHDWGYWGKPNMDGPEGERHPLLGAYIAGALFGYDYYKLVLLHSRYFAQRLGARPSKLCWADKYSMTFDPPRFYLWRARRSGELAEYRDNAARRQFIERTAPDELWLKKLTLHMARISRRQAWDENSSTRAAELILEVPS